MANPTTPANGAGQVPNPEPNAGQVPPSGEPSGTGDPNLSVDELRDALKKARSEAASHRTKLSAFEKAEQEKLQAQLSESEKVVKRAEQAEAQVKELTQTVHSMRVENAIKDLAGKLGIVAPALAAKLVNLSDVEFDADGQPENLEKLVRALVAEHSILSQPQQQNQAPQANQRPAPQSTMNPPRSRTVQAPAAPFDYTNRPRLGEIWKKNT